MTEAEGVIKYQLDFRQAVPSLDDLAEIQVWRSILHELGLVGRDPARYQGYGYGNLSVRSASQSAQFFITASQTGHLHRLSEKHYALVEAVDIERNHVVASGEWPPSSEALTHAMIYQLSNGLNCVLHIHDPLLWDYGLNNQWPKTEPWVEYGTPQMASEVKRLFRTGAFTHQRCLMMAGHQDGIICFGDRPASAGMALIQLWIAAHRPIED